MAIRKNLRNWLLRHPQINPYTVGNVGLLRLLSSTSRVFPNFLVIGAMKAGSTTLHQYINNHPNVIPASIKEVHYFDYYFGSDFGCAVSSGTAALHLAGESLGWKKGDIVFTSPISFLATR